MALKGSFSKTSAAIYDMARSVILKKKSFSLYQRRCENLPYRVAKVFHTAWLVILLFTYRLF